MNILLMTMFAIYGSVLAIGCIFWLIEIVDDWREGQWHLHRNGSVISLMLWTRLKQSDPKQAKNS